MIDSQPSSAIQAIVLLAEPPADMGVVLSAIQPGMGDPLASSPLLPAFGLTVNGADLRIGAFGGAVTNDRLLADLSVSPMRERLDPVVAAHRGVVTLEIAPPASGFFGPMVTWANVLAYLVDNLGAKALWLPQQRTVTTDVLFIGEMERDPALVLAGVHAMWLDQAAGTSLAFSAGLNGLGSPEVQIRRSGEPGLLYRHLRLALADYLGADRLPAVGDVLDVGGVRHEVVDGVSLTSGLPVLELVPAAAPAPRAEPAQAAAPAEPEKKRRRWPFG